MVDVKTHSLGHNFTVRPTWRSVSVRSFDCSRSIRPVSLVMSQCSQLITDGTDGNKIPVVVNSEKYAAVIVSAD